MQVSKLKRHQACSALLRMVKELPNIQAEVGFFKGLEYKDGFMSIYLRKRINPFGGIVHQLEVRIVHQPERLLSMQLRSVGDAEDLELLHHALLGVLGSCKLSRKRLT